LRSDGTALYPVADIPLAEEKAKKYKLARSIYVVDVRQGLYFKQLFKVMELLGHREKMIHLGFEFVKLPSGMMSSRTGNIITYEELKEQMMEKAARETKARHSDWSTEKILEVAKKITVGAMKFEMLKVSPGSVITFDIDQALRFDGFTSAYLQYTSARINSIIKNTENETRLSPSAFKYLTGKLEKTIILKLAEYPESVQKTGECYDISLVAKHLFDLARHFNEYYHETPILKAEKNIALARLMLIYSINQTIKNGLKLLGIETIDEM
jgi:arginyl-tRNA synthetase